MSRRETIVTRAAIARVLRACLSQGYKVRVILMQDGSTAFEPVDQDNREMAVIPAALDREIVL
jgi:hypothetical protein